MQPGIVGPRVQPDSEPGDRAGHVARIEVQDAERVVGGRQRWIGLHGGEQTLGGLRKPAKAATGLAAGVQKPGVARPQGQTAIEVGERVGRASLFDRDGTELKQLVGLCLDVGHGGVGHVKAPRGVSWIVGGFGIDADGDVEPVGRHETFGHFWRRPVQFPREAFYGDAEKGHG